jgi:hypothetical protein
LPCFDKNKLLGYYKNRANVNEVFKMHYGEKLNNMENQEYPNDTAIDESQSLASESIEKKERKTDRVFYRKIGLSVIAIATTAALITGIGLMSKNNKPKENDLKTSLEMFSPEQISSAIQQGISFDGIYNESTGSFFKGQDEAHAGSDVIPDTNIEGTDELAPRPNFPNFSGKTQEIGQRSDSELENLVQRGEF